MRRNLFPHTLQPCGFTPVCIFSCFLRLDLRLNFLPHSSHSNGFSLVCVSKCCLMWFLFFNTLSQIGHVRLSNSEHMTTSSWIFLKQNKCWEYDLLLNVIIGTNPYRNDWNKRGNQSVASISPNPLILSCMWNEYVVSLSKSQSFSVLI